MFGSLHRLLGIAAVGLGAAALVPWAGLVNAQFLPGGGAGRPIRPGFIQPMHGVTSRTALYRVLYKVTVPLSPILRRLIPSAFTTSDAVARAMVRVAREGAPERILETRDISRLGAP